MREWQTKVDNTAPVATGILTAAEDNARGEELENAVETAGITADAYNAGSDSDLTMLAQAMARYASGGIHAQDTGALNAHVLSTPLAFIMPKAYFKGMTVEFYPAATNTGAATVNAFGLGSKAILTQNGTTLVGNEIVANQLTQMVYDPALAGGAGAFKIKPWAVRTTAKIIPAGASLTLFVRTDGSDTGRDGLSNTAGSAFATIQAAINYAVSNYVISGATVIIQLGIAGTYTPFAMGTNFGGAAFTISGDTGNKANYIVSGSVGTSTVGIIAVTGGTLSFTGVTVNNAGTTRDTIYVSGAGIVQFADSRITSSGGTSTFSHFNANAGGQIVLSGAVETTGSMAAFAFSIGGTLTFVSGLVLTLTGTPAYSTAFGYASSLALLYLGATTFSGSATGKRYEAHLNAVINSFGQTLPGNSAGTTATGAQYA